MKDKIVDIIKKILSELEYPIIIEVPENYWVSSHNVEYIESS